MSLIMVYLWWITSEVLLLRPLSRINVLRFTLPYKEFAFFAILATLAIKG
ncbi:hypothetical protein G7B40_022845 [Aetokthonos hydrillicola Thurmond2011]|jgi:hypothetical protein|uniref:Uncharacterized protein n=1 Tax=Aetokthonos hydrillicola Thurmond2011 TaxID=2712845 RepID=A0AAP5I9E3_9CYAN|nr:hypothetical protein [Aetokthonos hydrillicola CCALA 1050]MBW4591278.1 hypothetical protein [Aetokthonos hydrillicola CCALA 1050]MDR9897383.1 hypothetical protein [Aetokthonos hydrillicola Thurmond2011]